MKKNLFALIALALFANACTKMDEGIEATSNSTFGSQTASITGTVTRVSDGKPITGSTVSVNYATSFDAHGNPTKYSSKQTNCDNNGNYILALTNSEVGVNQHQRPFMSLSLQGADAPYYLTEFVEDGVPIVPLATQHSMASPLPKMELNKNKRVDMRLHDIQYLNIRSKDITLNYGFMGVTVFCTSPITNQIISQRVFLNSTGFNAIRLPTKANTILEISVDIFKSAITHIPDETRRMKIKMDKKEVFLEMPN
jgi:hypothetical protein